MIANKLLYVISHGPYSNAAGQEALEAIMIGASFEQMVSVLFVHDGVFQIKHYQQKDQPTEVKEYTKTFQALSDFGVENFYCLESSLSARGLDTEQLIITTQIIDEASVNQLIQQQYRVFTF